MMAQVVVDNIARYSKDKITDLLRDETSFADMLQQFQEHVLGKVFGVVGVVDPRGYVARQAGAQLHVSICDDLVGFHGISGYCFRCKIISRFAPLQQNQGQIHANQFIGILNAKAAEHQLLNFLKLTFHSIF